ncbi:DUF1799 domain-containing protein [Gemmobacter sp.]|uniref:DUF1799 domain-containing protein n=1 Tax=Gemmobacter sp. TaxID=1898957 RepID=UPI002AFE90D2|nr:DUF1799 domain-containing protein [Gemmobacter sp.]
MLGVLVPAELITAEVADHECVEVLPVNWPSVLAFLACETQWRTAGTLAGLIWLGLDYPAVDVVLRRVAPEADFRDLQVMERGALEVFGEAG